MLLQKTEKARVELRPGVRTLGQRERTVLLLADGTRTLADLMSLYDGEGAGLAAKLIADGYLTEQSTRSERRAETPVGPRAAIPSAPQPMVAPARASAVSADSFEGKRSLATTRMFLFDLCERMFARRDPVLAEAFRDALRQAKDRDSMLAAGREMIAEIERIAGHERADSIAERIAMLLPPEMV